MHCLKREEILVVDRCKYKNKYDCYHVFLDQSKSMGILNFTHEIDLYFALAEEGIIFYGGWEMNCGGDWRWEENERDLFEEDHPGLLKEIETMIKEDRVRFCT